MLSIVKVEKLRAQVGRYILSYNDFEEALSYLWTKAPEENVIIRRALLTAAIIAYTRPFSSNQKGPSIVATATISLKVKNILSKEELALHKDLIKMRNLAIAHSTSELPHVVYYPKEPTAYVAGHHVFDPLTQTIDYTLFASACDKLRSACFDSMSKLNIQICKATKHIA
jgi:hypothetical protein